MVVQLHKRKNIQCKCWLIRFFIKGQCYPQTLICKYSQNIQLNPDPCAMLCEKVSFSVATHPETWPYARWLLFFFCYSTSTSANQSTEQSKNISIVRKTKTEPKIYASRNAKCEFLLQTGSYCFLQYDLYNVLFINPDNINRVYFRDHVHPQILSTGANLANLNSSFRTTFGIGRIVMAVEIFSRTVLPFYFFTKHEWATCVYQSVCYVPEGWSTKGENGLAHDSCASKQKSLRN